jgi:hypothetical protein
MPRPIFGTCTLTVLQQQRRGRAVATGQHSRTTLSRRVRIRDRTQHTWTALHTRSKRSARRQKVRRHPLIRPRSPFSIPACSPAQLIRPSTGRLSQQVAHHAVLHGLITYWGSILPASLQPFRCQAEVAQHSSRYYGIAVVYPAFFSFIFPSLITRWVMSPRN